MDKRSYNSPLKSDLDSCKKLKIAVPPRISPRKKSDENNGNAVNYQEQVDIELEGLCFDDSDDDTFLRSEVRLDLSSFKRCLVRKITESAKYEKVLHVVEKKTSIAADCCLRGVWYQTNVQEGETVSILAAWDDDRKMFSVTSEFGLIVTSPDVLISSTRVVGSLFCPRKSVLSERFQPIEFGNSTAMNVGTIIHEILQTVLKKNFTTFREIRNIADNYLKSRSMVHLLYACNITLEDLSKEIEPFISQIHDFVRRHIVGDLNVEKVPSNQNHQPFTGRISEIQDIEENVWCPRIGLKGKIDVTVKVNPPNKFFDAFQKLMPLEIKTGRASFSLEHKGQLILYQMMMEDLGKQIDSGLLLYIREGMMAEVSGNVAEKRGLIQMRNTLAHYLSMDLINKEREVNLPEPISHRSACGNCEHNTVCCVFVEAEPKLKLCDSHPLLKCKSKLTSNLSKAHIDYFLNWCSLITLEHNTAQKSLKLRHIWTKAPEVRAAKGIALVNLSIVDLVQPHDEEFLHHFGTSSNSIDFTSTSFEPGDYLIVSTDQRCSVAAGRVTEVQPAFISLSLQRDLSHQYSNCKFHLDRYESHTQSVFNFSNVGALLQDSETSTRLREIMVDKKPATFGKLPKSVAVQAERLLQQLNPVQRKSVLKAVTCENYMLIRGLPGTGKTQTLIHLIQLLISMKKSVLITSHTNSAVDNILLRLKERRVKFMRLGSVSRTHQQLKEFTEKSLISNCLTVEDLESVYNQYDVIAVTCLGSSHPLLSKKKFDYCLVDEATQIFQPTVIRPLLSAEKFVLVGDPQQLCPLIRSSDGRSLGAGESLFERLDAPESTTVLGLQYRMNRVITKLANNLSYGGLLSCAIESVEKATMKVPRMDLLQETLKTRKWLSKALSTNIDQSCSLLNTGDVQEISKQFTQSLKVETKSGETSEKNKLYLNLCEVAVVLQIVDLLVNCGVKSEAIGVIAPYRGQVEVLKKFLSHQSSVEVNTVDQYQGRDKEIIIYSCTQSARTGEDHSKSQSDIEILDDRRRLTVAITRAKHKLIIIGDVACLSKFTPFDDLFKHMSSVAKQKLEDDKFGFSWKVLLEKLKQQV